MSLTLEQLKEVSRKGRVISKNVLNAIGFEVDEDGNGLICNHYGHFSLYNIPITEETSKEEIIRIDNAYLIWQVMVKIEFEERGWELKDEYFSKDFNGNMMLLGNVIDIFGSMEPYLKTMERIVKMQKHHIDYTQNLCSTFLCNCEVCGLTKPEEENQIVDDYLKWKEEIGKVFREYGLELKDEHFSTDNGKILLLGNVMDIYSGVEPYRKAIEALAKQKNNSK